MRLWVGVVALAMVAVTTVPADRTSAEGGLGNVLPPVIAVWEDGINPYHVDFRLSGEAVPGFYAPGAEPLHLTYSSTSYEDALAADAELWDAVQFDRLYSFPGTRIVGAIHWNQPGVLVETPIIDTGGHGTAVASAAVGAAYGGCPDCRFVMVGGAGPEALEWLLAQDWIDAVSFSYSSIAGLGYPAFTHIEAFSDVWHDSGRSIFVSGGNVASGLVTHLDDYKPAPWVVRVGRGDPAQAHWSRTYELVGRAAEPWATHDSIDEYAVWAGAGTSFSSPNVAGVYGSLLHSARQALGDSDGRSAAALASGPSDAFEAGPLADGLLTADELERVLFDAARPISPPVTAIPRELSYFWEGFGLVDGDSVPQAGSILVGDASPPDKPWPEWWYSMDHYVRGPWGSIAHCPVSPAWIGCAQQSGWDPMGMPGLPPVSV